MANFNVREVEGMRQVCIDIDNESIRACRGALSNMCGDITLTPKIPSGRDILRGFFTHEARIRPFYTGTGSIMLQPSLGGYHILDIPRGESWILEPGIYWASENSVTLGLFREKTWPSYWAGDGLLSWKTTVTGPGKVAINAHGPVETVQVSDDDLKVQGHLVLGRTAGLDFSSQRSTSLIRNFFSGQKRLRVFSGSGKALVCWTPYWNQHMYMRVTGETIEHSLFE